MVHAFKEGPHPPFVDPLPQLNGLGTRHPSFAAQTLVSLVRPDLFLAALTVWARDTLRLLRKRSCPSCVQTYSWQL
jgi:hypothetical protein